MLVLEGLKSDAALQRGLLWHSWLKNQIIRMDARYVEQMHRRPSLLEERESFEQKIQPGGVFEAKINEAKLFAHGMVDGFSPGQLVDTGPFIGLPSETRDIIRSVLHSEYLHQTNIDKCVKPIESAIGDMEQVFKEFAKNWYEQPAVEKTEIQESFERLKEHAKALHELLGRLPEGIILP